MPRACKEGSGLARALAVADNEAAFAAEGVRVRYVRRVDKPDPNLSPRPNNGNLPWYGSGYGSRSDVGRQFRGPLRVVGAVILLLVVAFLLRSHL